MSDDWRILTGCIDERLNNTAVRVLGELSADERRQFRSDKRGPHWVKVLTPYGEAAVDRRRLRAMDGMKE